MENSEFKKYQNQKSGYRVPDTYFDEKRKSLLNLAVEKPASGIKLIHWNFAWVASGIAAALLIGFFIWQPADEAKFVAEFDLEYEELADYVYTSYNYELSEQLLLLELTEEDLGMMDTAVFSADELELLIDENFDQTLNYEYL